MKDITFRGQGKSSSPVLKVPRQCSFVLLVEIYLREGRDLGRSVGESGWVNCFWASSAQKFLAASPLGLMTTFHCVTALVIVQLSLKF
jgi:hypothetical protein